MPFYFDFKSSILLFFFLHANVFAILLLVRSIQTGNKANRWLGTLIFLCALYISPFMLGYGGWYGLDGYREVLFYLPLQQLLAIPPMLYFYVKTQLDSSFRFSKKSFLHFLPGAIYILYTIWIFTNDIIIGHSKQFYADGRDRDFEPWYQIAGFVSLLLYAILSMKLYKKYRLISLQSVSFADSITFAWIKKFLAAMIILLILRAAFFVANPEWDQFGRKFWYYLCFSLLMYSISIAGYTNFIKSVISFSPFELFEHRQATDPQNLSPKDGNQQPKNHHADFQLWKTALEVLMETRKAYQNPALTLSDVAIELGLNQKQVSQVVNEGFGMNFNDLVNSYRIEEVIKKIDKKEHTLLTLLGIALDCGFNSKTTFNRAFRKKMGKSPSEYLKEKSKKKVPNQDLGR